MSITIDENKFLLDNERSRLEALIEAHKGTRDSLMFLLALKTGARSCEILALTVSSFGEKCVTIVGAKRSNSRTLPLEASVNRAVQEYIKAHNLKPSDRLFPISSRHYRRIWDAWRPNPKKGSHSTRHTMGVKLYDNCTSVLTVKQVLGHKSIKNTEIYVNYVEGQRSLRTRMKGMWKKKLA